MKGYYMSDRYQPEDAYLIQKVQTASNEQLISYILDAGIAACVRKDRVKAHQAVQELMNALNHDHDEMATNFFQLYRYIMSLIQKGKYDEAYEMLVEIKQTWCEAMNIR